MTYKGKPPKGYVTEKGNVSYSVLYEQMDVAFQWHMHPYDYLNLPVDERALMTQYLKDKGLLDSAISAESARLSRLNRPRGSRS